MEPVYSYGNQDYHIDTKSVQEAIEQYNALKSENTSVWLGVKIVQGNVQMEAKAVNFWNWIPMLLQRFFGIGELDWDFKEVSGCLSRCIPNISVGEGELEKFSGYIDQSINKYRDNQDERIQ